MADPTPTAAPATPAATSEKGKPFYKKVKLMTAIGAVLISGLTIFLKGSLSPETLTFIGTVIVMAIALITGHTVTDIKTSVAEITSKN